MRPVFAHYTISIHAPHARSDVDLIRDVIKPTISIHAPHARSDRFQTLRDVSPFQFQSTLLMRGATCAVKLPVSLAGISIHAPHARSDPYL